eukprot:sb/3471080/
MNYTLSRLRWTFEDETYWFDADHYDKENEVFAYSKGESGKEYLHVDAARAKSMKAAGKVFKCEVTHDYAWTGSFTKDTAWELFSVTETSPNAVLAEAAFTTTFTIDSTGLTSFSPVLTYSVASDTLTVTSAGYGSHSGYSISGSSGGAAITISSGKVTPGTDFDITFKIVVDGKTFEIPTKVTTYCKFFKD